MADDGVTRCLQCLLFRASTTHTQPRDGEGVEKKKIRTIQTFSIWQKDNVACRLYEYIYILSLMLLSDTIVVMVSSDFERCAADANGQMDYIWFIDEISWHSLSLTLSILSVCVTNADATGQSWPVSIIETERLSSFPYRLKWDMNPNSPLISASQ